MISDWLQSLRQLTEQEPEFVDENTRTDLLGNPRPEGVNPDVGAYQYMTPTE